MISKKDIIKLLFTIVLSSFLILYSNKRCDMSFYKMLSKYYDEIFPLNNTLLGMEKSKE